MSKNDSWPMPIDIPQCRKCYTIIETNMKQLWIDGQCVFTGDGLCDSCRDKEPGNKLTGSIPTEFNLNQNDKTI